MSVASKKRKRWARRLARVQLMRRMAGLPEHAHPERVVFESMRRIKFARRGHLRAVVITTIEQPMGVRL